MLLNLGLFFIAFLSKKEVMTMAAIYVALIVKGLRTFSSVPVKIQPQVREMLIDLELEYLIDEE